MSALSCPGRDAAFFMPLRRTGTPVRYSKLGPGSAAHHAARAARCAASGARSLVGMSCSLAFMLIAALAAPALAQDRPKPLKTIRIREPAPGADILYAIDENGTARIDWPAVETLAASKADPPSCRWHN